MAKPLHDQVIVRALAIIEDGSRWTKGNLARLSNGVECPCFDPRAERFCAAGALYRAACELSGANSWLLAKEAEQCVLMRNGWRHLSLPNVNDIEGHEYVVAMFRKSVGKGCDNREFSTRRRHADGAARASRRASPHAATLTPRAGCA